MTVRIDRTPPEPRRRRRSRAETRGAAGTTSRSPGAIRTKATAHRSSRRSTSFARPPAANCARGEHVATGVARLATPVPGPGAWTVSLWRRDAAGNEAESMASVPVTLRYDPDAPQLGFEPTSPSDPTLVAVKATDAVSGVADGGIEISAAGSGVWQTLPVQRQGDQLIARIDDAGLAPGAYELPGASGRPGRQRGVERSAAGRPAHGRQPAAARRVGAPDGVRPRTGHARARPAQGTHADRRAPDDRADAGGTRVVRRVGAGRRQARGPGRDRDSRARTSTWSRSRRWAPKRSSRRCRPAPTAASPTPRPASRTARCGSPTPARRDPSGAERAGDDRAGQHRVAGEPA